MKRALYPGSFDPITFGHIDIVTRALTIFDELLIGISINSEKTPVFSLTEREALLKQCFPDDKRVKVISFSGLLIDFARSENIPVVVRGLRAASDFEYEFQLAAMNRSMDRNFETVFLMTGSDTYFLSSRLVKEIAFLGGNISKMVPAHVATALNAKRSL